MLSKSVPELFFGWRNLLGKNQSQIWNLIPSCIIWTLWRERNNRTFENVERTDSQFNELFSNTLYDWAIVWGYSSSTYVISFLDSLHLPSYSSSLFIHHFCVHTLCTQSGSH